MTHRPDSWTPEEIRRVGYAVVDLIAQHLTDVHEGPVFRPVPRQVADAFLSGAPPHDGAGADAILQDFADTIAPYPFGNGHRRFFGWVNSPPTVMGIFAEALGAAMNPSVAGGNHAAVYVERQVVNWLRQMIGMPAESMGILVSGGSVAAITALAVARHVSARRAGWNIRDDGLQQLTRRFVVYKGAEAHGCHLKAVELLGLGNVSVREVPSDGELRVIPSVLERLIAEDLAAGHIPMAVIASAGTVNTGAIDPLDAIADVCAMHDVWLHVDAAYGGPAVLSERYRGPLKALERADSVTMDPHKWLYVPVEAGLVLVRDAAAMRETFSLVPPYLRTDGNVQGVQGPPWFSEFGIQQTRGFRALKTWMALRYHGFNGYRKLINHDIDLARYLAALMASRTDFQCWLPQSLSIVCFRYLPPTLRDDVPGVDELNKAILSDVQMGGNAFLSSTVLNGRFWLRACIVNPLADESDVEALVRTVEEIGRMRMAST